MAKRIDDFTNKTFGLLHVEEKVTINNKTYWKCKCKCGNYKTVRHNLLKRGGVKTCGCRGTFKDNVQKSLEKYRVNGTYLPTITNKRKLNKNNTSGYKGVSYRKDRGKYRAYIKFQGKDIFLGNFDNIDDAIKVRQQAEKKYFGMILDNEDNNKDF